MALLLKNGFNPDLPTYVIWEGNTMYLPRSSDMAILRELRDNLKNFHVSFDYFAEAMISKTTGVLGLTCMIENFENMNAPWVTGFDDIRALADEMSLRVVDDTTTGALHRVYRPTVEMPAFGPFYSICTLASRRH